MKEVNSLLYFFLLVKFCLGNNAVQTGEEEEKVKPGAYTQWKEKLPLIKLDHLGNINPNYKPDCKAECVKRCDGHKGVSICGSMFEYADDPNDDSMVIFLQSDDIIRSLGQNDHKSAILF